MSLTVFWREIVLDILIKTCFSSKDMLLDLSIFFMALSALPEPVDKLEQKTLVGDKSVDS